MIMKSALEKQKVVLLKKKYHSPTLTVYGSIAQLTMENKGGPQHDGGTPPFHKAGFPS